jgi:16S rRNA (cytosine967-C5)-methyltransferase
MPISPRALALDVLLSIEESEAYSHIALDAALRRHNLSPRDRGLATCIVYGTLAYQRRLDAELSGALRSDLYTGTPALVRVGLRLALFQLRYLDRVPAHAVLNEAVSEIKRRRGPKLGGLVNAVLRRLVTAPPVTPPAFADDAARLAWTYSLPDALAAQALARFSPEDAERWATAMNSPPPLTARVNLSRVPFATAQTELNAEPCRWASAALHLPSGLDPAARAALEQHRCAIQDEGSQLVTLFAGPFTPSDLPTPHAAIWDVCAGQGGKTNHLADLLHLHSPKTELWATDLHEKKLERLQRSPLLKGLRLHVDTVDARYWQAPRLFSLVLLDAPCSGLGLMRRHPETRWRRPQSVEALALLQSQLLRATARAVAPGGLLLYAVCTSTPEETTQQIDAFLRDSPDFSLESPPPSLLTSIPALADLITSEGLLSIGPYPHDTDGFFAARLRRRA